MQNSQRLRITSMGFWLPCNESFFFHHDEDSDILDKKITQDHRLTQLADKDNNLQSSVFHRLMAVLYHKHYTHVYALPDPVGIVSKKDKADPKTLIFAADPANNGLLDASQTPLYWRNKDDTEPTIPLRGMALIVNDSGFYLWIVVYASQYADDQQAELINEEARTARDHLQEHVFDCIGGSYFSHYSGSEEDAPKVTDEVERQQNLAYYQNELLGMLTFYQINLILEGLYNATLDPRVFFASEPEDLIKQIKRKYSLAAFINLIASPLKTEQFLASAPPALTGSPTIVRGAPSTPNAATEPPKSDEEVVPTYTEGTLIQDVLALHMPNALDNEQSHALTERLVQRFLVNSVLRPIIGRFLSATSDKSLQSTKRRVERCRRALLSAMLEVTHRRQPLVQVEPPGDQGGERIEGVDEDQLRGYVMILAAKLPLITTVELHLQGIIEMHKLWDIHTGSPWDSWRMVMSSIDHDINRLETALEQANMDRQLDEEEQIRAEQETLAELERLRSRTEETISPTFSVSISYFANILALIAVALTIIATFKNFVIVSPLQTFSDGSFWLHLLDILVYAIFLALGYFAIQSLLTRTLQFVRLRSQHQSRIEDKFYYEFDLRLQAPITAESAQTLFNAELAKVYLDEDGKKQSTDDFFRDIMRNTYRVQRTAKDAALHKVYIEIDLLLRPKVRRSRVHAILVYEVRFHSPTKGHEYILQDLRVVINHRRILDIKQINYLKEMIATHFVNYWITDTSWQISHDPTDAFYTLKGPQGAS